MNSNRHKTIARNTVFLYVRTVLALLISLYASRVVLDALGASDFGIFNLVGGFLVFFSFFNASAGNATQRFLSFEAGSGGGRSKKVFAAASRVHIYIAIGVLVVSETFGLWFVNNGLAIAPDKMAAANVAYQAAVVAALASIIEIPFVASIMSAERMGAYSCISIVHMLLKLGIALAIASSATADRLTGYSVLYAAMSVGVMLMWSAYALKTLHFTRTLPHADADFGHALIGFLGWDSFARFSGAARVQGIAVLINRFGGTVLNAGLAISMQVYAAMIQLGQAVTLAFRPQVIERYASGDHEGFASLAGNCSRYAFLPVAAAAIPLIIDTDYLLTLWLGDVPPFTAAFCRITLITALAQILATTCSVAIEATGNIRLSSIAEGIICLAELPAAWMLLHFTGRPVAALAIHPFALALIVGIQVAILRRQVPGFCVSAFVRRDILLPCTIALAAFAAAMPLTALEPGFGRFCAVTAVSLLVMTAGTGTFMPEVRKYLFTPEKH